MKVFFVSLGCDKNLADSEHMISLLRERGHEITEEESLAEVIVINSCCFIHDAKEESINTILEMAEYKQKGSLRLLVVTGCLSERFRKEIREELPEVDILLGTSSYLDIADAIECGTGQVDWFRDLNYIPEPITKREHFTGTTYAYLKIAEGCNKCCTYCIIPKIRGSYRSFPQEVLLKEAEELVSEGVKEIILVAQETTVYGNDLYGRKALPELLRKLCQINGLEWVRILYCYPEEISDELVQVITEEDKIVKYLDIPIQHASDSVLHAMGRKTSKKELVSKIEKLRKDIPGLVLRTSLITGFPGETEGDFEELEDFIRQMRFERLGVFTYSREEGTAAAKMKQQVPEKVKKDRRNRLMRIQQTIAFEQAKKSNRRCSVRANRGLDS